MSDVNYCPETGKAMMPTRRDAMAALRNMRDRKTSKGAVYQCPYCHAFHVTHLSYRKSKAIRTFNGKKEKGLIEF